MSKRWATSLLLLAALFWGGPASAQGCGANMAANTVCGRLGIGPGLPQAIPFTTLAPQLVPSARTKLPTGTTNLFVNASATGCGGGGCNDGNPGLTQNTAMKTVLGALYRVLNTYDFTSSAAGQSTVVINMLADEINAGNPVHFGAHDFVGASAGGSVTLDGGNFTLEYDSASTPPLQFFFGPSVQIQNIKLVNTVSQCVQLLEHADVRFGAGVVLGNCAIGVYTAGGATLTMLQGVTITQSAFSGTAFFQALQNSSIIVATGSTITVTNPTTMTWNTLVQSGAVIDFNNASWSGGGNVTGQKYLAQDGRIVNGAANIPGTSAGSTSGSGSADGVASFRQILGFGNAGTALPQNATSYVGVIASGTEAFTQFLCPLGGTFKNLYVAETAPSAGQTSAVTLRVAGADTALTCTVTGTATTCNDTTHTATCTAGQAYSLKVINSATTGSIANFAAGAEFDSP